MSDAITSYYEDRDRTNNKTIQCGTCYYRGNGCRYAKINNSIEQDVFTYCLKRIPYYEMESFVHRRFPNYYRANKEYEYIQWIPNSIVINMLLTDKDFEI